MAAMKAYFHEQISGARDSYMKDLEALSPELLASKPGQSTRSAYDYTYEVAVVNHRLAKRLRGETPEKLGEGWMMVPAEMHDKAKIQAEFTASMDDVLAAWDALSDEQVANFEGDYAPIKLAGFCTLHASYHDAQLNMLQSMAGDAEVHW